MINKLYFPTLNNKPAPIEVKGHKILLVSQDKSDIYNDLEFLGGDKVKHIKMYDNDISPLEKLANQTNAGIVINPIGLPITVTIKELENKLNWVN